MAKMLQFLSEHSHCLTVSFGALASAVGVGYWGNENSKQIAVLAEKSRADKAEVAAEVEKSRAE
eukprot:882408-Rhodomonas_salina.1